MKRHQTKLSSDPTPFLTNLFSPCHESANFVQYCPERSDDLLVSALYYICERLIINRSAYFKLKDMPGHEHSLIGNDSHHDNGLVNKAMIYIKDTKYRKSLLHTHY